MANAIIVNKVGNADPQGVKLVELNIKKCGSDALILDAASPITVDCPELGKGKRALGMEHGPILTHGNMLFGAAATIIERIGASEIINPEPCCRIDKRGIQNVQAFRKGFSQLGYGEKQIAELKETIERTPCDVVVIGTPIDLRKVNVISKSTARVKYKLQVFGSVSLEQTLENFFERGDDHERGGKKNFKNKSEVCN